MIPAMGTSEMVNSANLLKISKRNLHNLRYNKKLREEFNYTIFVLHNFLQFAYIFTKTPILWKSPPKQKPQNYSSRIHLPTL